MSPKPQLPIYDERGRLLAYTVEELARLLGMSPNSKAFLRMNLIRYDDRRVVNSELLSRHGPISRLRLVTGVAARYLPIVDEDGNYLGGSADEVGAKLHMTANGILRRLVLSRDGQTRILRPVANLPIVDEHGNLLGDSLQAVADRLYVSLSTLRRYTEIWRGVRRIVHVERIRTNRPLKPLKRAKTGKPRTKPIYDERGNLLGYKYQEVAEQLGVTVGSLRSYVTVERGVQRVVDIERLRRRWPAQHREAQ